MIRLMIVDDHAILRDGLKNLLELEDDIQVVGEAVSGEEAIKKVKECDPGVLLMDINMPKLNGVEVTGIIKKLYPEKKILILTMHSHDEYFMAAIRGGADGYILKESPFEQVIHAIRMVAKGESVIHPTMTKKLLNFHQQRVQEEQGNNLTDREKEVLQCLVDGLSNKEIAERLYISDKTVKIHVSKIFKKLQVKSRSQVVIYAVQNKLVNFSETT